MTKDNATRPYTVRPAESAEDGALIVGLIRALADFERLEGPDDEAAARIIRDGFETDPPMYRALLAVDDSESDTPGGAIGYAITFNTYSTFLGKPSLYLEDLFVLPAHRGRGIGKALLMRCIEIARQTGCGRVEWSVLDWNTEAQRFYNSLGAKHLKEWHLYRLDSDAIDSLTVGSEPT